MTIASLTIADLHGWSSHKTAADDVNTISLLPSTRTAPDALS
jgi:hypothetical protein